MKLITRLSSEALLRSLAVLATVSGLLASPASASTQTLMLSTSPSVQLFTPANGSFIDIVNFNVGAASSVFATVASFDMPIAASAVIPSKKEVKREEPRNVKGRSGNSGRGRAGNESNTFSRKSRNEGANRSSDFKSRDVIEMPSVFNFVKHISGLNISLFDSSNELIGTWKNSPVSFSSTLLSGNYRLEVAGNADGREGGAYVLGLMATANPIISPIPEPQTWMLMIGGLALFGALARRRPAPAVLADLH